MPGWIQNFLIGLVQRGALTICTVPRSEVVNKPGVVMPAETLIQKPVEIEDGTLSKRRSAQVLISGAVAAQRLGGQTWRN